MTGESFQLAVISAGVLINLPLVGFLLVLMHSVDKRLVRVETKLETGKEN